MKTGELEEILAWLRGTDLVEVAYKESGRGFALSTSESSPAALPLPSSRYIPVLSPAIGLFQWARLGEARRIEEGSTVGAGETLALVETAPGKSVPVSSPAAGRVARIFAEGGAPVEFGQPLLFLEG